MYDLLVQLLGCVLSLIGFKSCLWTCVYYYYYVLLFIIDDKILNMSAALLARWFDSIFCFFTLPSTDTDLLLLLFWSGNDVERRRAGCWVPYRDLKMWLLAGTDVVPLSGAAP